jgi:endonuclease/exonuclease/phosphatase family metal-dependent hydrolase
MDIVSRITQSLAILTIATSTMSSLALNPDVVEQPQSDALVEQYQKARDMMRQYGLENAPAKAEQSFRLTTYNIENLFDAHDDPSLTGRNDDADETKPEHELTATAMAIRAVNPDVLCIQEVESEAALLEYRDNYLSDMGYEYVVSIDAGNDRGIENSVLSRFPISNVENWPNMPLGGVHPEKYGTQKNWYAGEPINFRRSPLMVDLEIPSSEDGKTWTLTLFVMHHKSGRFNTYWREAEATGTLKLIKDVLAADQDRAIVLLGDFNAEVDDQSVQTYLKGGFVDIFEDHTSKTETITHESGRRIDLILANKAALSRMNPESGFVYGTAARPEGVNWRDMETFDGYAADHYPVSVDVKY